MKKAPQERGGGEWPSIATTKAVLMRYAGEYEIALTPEAVRYLDTLPDTFKEWVQQQKARPPEIRRAA